MSYFIKTFQFVFVWAYSIFRTCEKKSHPFFKLISKPSEENDTPLKWQILIRIDMRRLFYFSENSFILLMMSFDTECKKLEVTLEKV